MLISTYAFGQKVLKIPSKTLAGVGFVWGFIFVLAPWAQRLGPIAEIHGCIEERGIDATALFYTESEAFGPVQLTLHNGLRLAGSSAP